MKAALTNGVWTAQIKSIGIGGGMISVTAIPNSDNGGNGSGGGSGDSGGGGTDSGNPNPISPGSVDAQAAVDSPQGIFISDYHYNYASNYCNVVVFPKTYDNITWEDGKGGNENNGDYKGLYVTDAYAWPSASWPESLPDGTKVEAGNYVTNWPPRGTPYCWTNTWGPPVLRMEHCDGYEQYSYSSSNMWTDSFMTEDAQVLLATGGPLGSTQKDLWVISATATDLDTGLQVPPEEISIGGLGKLDADGNLCVMMSGHAKATVMVRVPKKNYSFAVKGQKYPMAIMANGVVLSNDVVAAGADFCVGQGITFEIVGLPDHKNKDDDVASWTLPGAFVNQQPDPNCNAYFDRTNTLLRHYLTDKTISTFCWYVKDGQEMTASVDVFYRYTSSAKPFEVPLKGKFNVHRPTTQFVKYDRGTPTVMVTNGMLTLGYGGSNCMSFHHQISTSFPGKVGYTQLITGECTRSSSGLHFYVATNGYALDNLEFPRGTVAIPSSTNIVYFWDGPGVGLYKGYGSMNASFFTYLLFMPDAGPGPNIYVPLRLVTWTLDDEAANYDCLKRNFGKPEDNDCCDFPHWVSIFDNTSF